MPLAAVDHERARGSSLVSVAALRLTLHSVNMRLSGPGAYPARAVFGSAIDRVVEPEYGRVRQTDHEK
jgi:hypothetical protein